MGTKLLFLGALFFVTTVASAQVIEFHITAGTGESDWNTQNSMVTVKVGDTLRIFNDDTINHRLHTDGRPCPHGDEMAPGTSTDNPIQFAYDPTVMGPLHDHDNPQAQFWLEATE